MARAYIAVDEWEDTSVGLDGGHARVPWISEIDNPGDDPYTQLTIVAPPGAAHPRTRFAGLVVTGYDSPQLLNEYTFRVWVNYSPASDRTIGLWRRSVRFANETRDFKYSLPEFNAEGVRVTKSFLVGSASYDPVDSNDQSTNLWAHDAYGASKQKVKPNGRIEDENFSVNTGITAIVYEILVPQLSADKVRRLSALKWHTNQFIWLGYQSWELIFSNWECHDEVIVMPAAGRGNVAQWFSNVAIEILYRPRSSPAKDSPDAFFPFGWRAMVRTDFYRSESGKVMPVFDNSVDPPKPVNRTWVQYPQISFNSLFGIIGGSPSQ